MFCQDVFVEVGCFVKGRKTVLFVGEWRRTKNTTAVFSELWG